MAKFAAASADDMDAADALAAASHRTDGGLDATVALVRVEVVLLTLRAGRLSVLLVERDEPPEPHTWALPGGGMHPDEDLDAAARRTLADQTGVHEGVHEGVHGHLEQLRTYGAPGGDPGVRLVSVAYLALLPDLPAPSRAGSGSGHVRWWPVEDLGPASQSEDEDEDEDEGEDRPSLAFDHGRIVGDGVERARAKLEYTPLAAAFVDEPFTLAELRRVYEAAWGVPLDAPNFRRKVLSTPGFVVPLGERASRPGGGRPAELYRRGDATALSPPLLRPER